MDSDSDDKRSCDATHISAVPRIVRVRFSRVYLQSAHKRYVVPTAHASTSGRACETPNVLCSIQGANRLPRRWSRVFTSCQLALADLEALAGCWLHGAEAFPFLQ